MSMARLKDNLWIWGQPAGSHHKVENNMWNLPGENKMGPLEGAKHLGIPNICIVTSGDDPAPPFDNLAEELKECPNVVWSIIGDAWFSCECCVTADCALWSHLDNS